jgi:hypothetical protein
VPDWYYNNLDRLDEHYALGKKNEHGTNLDNAIIATKYLYLFLLSCEEKSVNFLYTSGM